MKIGYTKFNINPKEASCKIFNRDPVLEVKDALYCRMIHIQAEQNVYMLSIDSVGCPRSLRDKMKEAMEKAIGMPIELSVSASHSHYCPDLRKDEIYQQFLTDKIVENMLTLHIREIKSPSIAYQYRYFDKVGKSRISNQESPYVYAETVSLYEENKRILTWVIHNVHPTILNFIEPWFSAEYPGMAMKALEEQYPDEFFTFMLGAAGDISSRFVRTGQSYEDVKKAAKLFTTEIITQLNTPVKRLPVSDISYEQITFSIDRQFSDIDSLEIPQDLSPREWETIHQGEEVRKHIVLNQLPKDVLFSRMNFGAFSFLFAPFELFSAYIGAVNKENAVLVSVTNGIEGYVTMPGKQRLTYELFADTVSPSTKQRIIDLLKEWSSR